MWSRSVLAVGLAWGTMAHADGEVVDDAPSSAAAPTNPTANPTTTQQTVVPARRLDRPVGDAVIEAMPTTASVPAGGTASDLLRRAPGVFISQHSGQGKAHQIFLRGFDAEHGQDLEVSVDGVPQNDVSHLHGQGYADVTLLPPELVRRLVLRPGAYDVRQGDFAVAGSLDFELGAPAKGPLLRTTLGDFGLMRLVGIVSPDPGDDDRTCVAGEAARGDGFGPRRAFQRASAVAQGRMAFGVDDVLLVAGMVADVAADDEAVRAGQALGRAMRAATSVRAATWDCTAPNTEIWVCSLLALLAKAVSGAFSRATNLLMMPEESSPLPMPTDEMVAIRTLLK